VSCSPWRVTLPRKRQPRTYGWSSRRGPQADVKRGMHLSGHLPLSWMLLTQKQEVRRKMESGSALGTAKWPVGDFKEGALRFGKDRAPQLRLCVAGDTKLVGQETDDRFQ